MTDTLEKAAGEVHSARNAARQAADHGHRALDEAVATGERLIGEAARKAERAIRDSLETLRGQTRAYTDSAGQHMDEAQRYVVERVKERPVTATLTGLGVGLLVGLLLASRTRD